MSCGFLSAHHFKDACPFSNLLTSNISLSCAILALRTFDHQNKKCFRLWSPFVHRSFSFFLICLCSIVSTSISTSIDISFGLTSLFQI